MYPGWLNPGYPAGTTRSGENRDGFGFNLKPTGFGGDQNPGTRRVRVPEHIYIYIYIYICKFDVSLTISLETLPLKSAESGVPPSVSLTLTRHSQRRILMPLAVSLYVQEDWSAQKLVRDAGL